MNELGALGAGWKEEVAQLGGSEHGLRSQAPPSSLTSWVTSLSYSTCLFGQRKRNGHEEMMDAGEEQSRLWGLGREGIWETREKPLPHKALDSQG